MGGGRGWAKHEFEKLWEGDIQGYCSVDIGKQIPTIIIDLFMYT